MAQLRSAPAYERDAGRWRAVLEDPHRTETEAQAALAQPPGFVNVQAQAVREYLLGKQYEKAPAALSTLILGVQQRYADAREKASDQSLGPPGDRVRGLAELLAECAERFTAGRASRWL